MVIEYDDSMKIRKIENKHLFISITPKFTKANNIKKCNIDEILKIARERTINDIFKQNIKGEVLEIIPGSNKKLCCLIEIELI